MSKKLGTLLLQAGIIESRELEESLEQARRRNVSLWDVIINEKQVSEESLAEAFSKWLKLPRVALASVGIEPEATKAISEEVAKKHLCIPIKIEGKAMMLAMANPADYDAIQDVEFASGKRVQPVVATRTEILDAIVNNYDTAQRAEAFLANVAEAGDFEIVAAEEEQEDLEDMDTRNAAELPPVVKLCNAIIKDAIKSKASDIHIEATLNDVQVRLRVDGVLREYMQIPKWLQTAVVSRLKILAKLDIAEKRVPQDGRIKVVIAGKPVDLRVSTLPTHFGEKVVLRVLGSSEIPTFKQMGYSDSQIAVLESAINQPQGLILVTGPTGSGKSTTLYSCLNKRKSPEVNIVTVEDPIEYQIKGINQVQVNTKAGLTFAAALRSILRQDPDVVLVGEIRDLETAEIAFHAAMTGHLVMSTLHTNSSLATIARLLDMGVDAVSITSSITLITAQRLARRVCSKCKEEYTPSSGLLEKLKIDEPDMVLWRGRGCSACGQTGFSGRVGLYELLRMTPTLKDLINRKAPESDLRKAAGLAGTRFLLEDAMDKVRQGITTLEEVLRVIQLQEEEIIRCPKCGSFINMDFSSCPYCLHALKHMCRSCGQELKLEWRICPYCNTRTSRDGDIQAPPKVLTATAGGEAEPQPEAAAPARAATRPAPKRPRVLVVDDDPGIKTVIQKAISQLPVELDIATASDGAEAIAAIEQHPPDLVILDVMMPRMDGFSVCQKMREDVRTAFVPVMMLTANADETNRTKGYLVGTDDYMNKPFSVPDLNARVMRLLRRTYGL
jgi:type IV pilus assembly protein PilB